MITSILLALINGGCISICRIINGRLGQETGALNASLWNHLVGFGFLCLVVWLMAATSGSSASIAATLDAPLLAWTGGIIGALFVTLNSYVLPRLGASLTALLVIGGQLLTGVALDAMSRGVNAIQLLGVLLILAAVWLTKRSG
ncbi:DMT family transporter [Photobacterium sp. TY1-4]|uniref:DMT family transporter n=1 Tax=Photobacterium sp. TY1-4 TaxID=2899122 RepID=UPI0021BE1E38|nr:DMT family transporter [Photobacterium sp. TY1-4]UXI03111.1 DMT family transporter [Photobacterium sp. TY1-4]